MRQLFILTFFVAGFSMATFGQKNKTTTTRPEDQLDKYYFVMIKAGPNQDIDSVKREELFKGHMDNINRLYYDGIIKVAGPLGKNDLTWRGIFVYDCKNREEAEKYAQTDPAIAAGLFSVDIVAWLTSPIGSFKHGKPKKPKSGK